MNLGGGYFFIHQGPEELRADCIFCKVLPHQSGNDLTEASLFSFTENQTNRPADKRGEVGAMNETKGGTWNGLFTV